MSVVCAIVDSILERHLYPEQAPWLIDDNRSDDNPSINGLITWAFALITYVFDSFSLDHALISRQFPKCYPDFAVHFHRSGQDLPSSLHLL